MSPVGGWWLRKEYAEMCSPHYPQSLIVTVKDFLQKQPNERTEFHTGDRLWEWGAGTPALWREKALICHVCQSLWCKYSHRGWCQATKNLTTGLQNS